MFCLLVLECACYFVSESEEMVLLCSMLMLPQLFCLFGCFGFFQLGENNLELQESPIVGVHTVFHFFVPDLSWPILLLSIIFVILVLSFGNNIYLFWVFSLFF